VLFKIPKQVFWEDACFYGNVSNYMIRQGRPILIPVHNFQCMISDYIKFGRCNLNVLD
jgi:hypothetical protein